MVLFYRGLFTWPNQDDRMNMTENGEHDWKIDNDYHLHGELDRNYNKYYHNDKPIRENMTKSWNNKKYNKYLPHLKSPVFSSRCYYQISHWMLFIQEIKK